MKLHIVGLIFWVSMAIAILASKHYIPLKEYGMSKFDMAFIYGIALTITSFMIVFNAAVINRLRKTAGPTAPFFNLND